MVAEAFQELRSVLLHTVITALKGEWGLSVVFVRGPGSE